MDQAILSTSGLSKHFGALAALEKVDVTVLRGQIHGLIGPNGAGKTTFANVISGFIPATEGKVIFDDRDITKVEPHKIAKMGLSRTFQLGQIFPRMTCLQNVMVGRHCRIRTGILQTAFHPPFVHWKDEDDTRQRALELLESVGLADSAGRWASDLVWVECQLLQIARALASEPQLLVLDEPTAGMGIEESKTIGNIIMRVQGMGITIVLISHDIRLVMDIASRITVLSFGQKIHEGTPKEAQNDPKVLEAYLGTEEHYS